MNFLHDFTLFVVDIHQIRLISFFRHFPDHFHFHGSAGLIPKVNLSLRPNKENLSFPLQMVHQGYSKKTRRELIVDLKDTTPGKNELACKNTTVE